MAYQRMKAVKSGEMDIRYFKTYDFGRPPKKVIQSSRQFTNLFEMPMLFLFVATIFVIKGHAGYIEVSAAWIFVIARYFQAYFHLTKNKIDLRFLAFATSVLANLFLWISLFIKSF
jgi:hypothetical protein